MEAITIHKLNERLVVSLAALPGFRKLGTVVVKDEQSLVSGEVIVYFAGAFFNRYLEEGEFEKARNQITKLVRNYAVKNEFGVSTGRISLSITLRERENAGLATV